MENYQHRILTDMDESGFGVKYETNLSIFTPRHWHRGAGAAFVSERSGDLQL